MGLDSGSRPLSLVDFASDAEGHSAYPLSTPRTSAGPVRGPCLGLGSGSTSLCLEDFALDADGKCGTPVVTAGAAAEPVRSRPDLGLGPESLCLADFVSDVGGVNPPVEASHAACASLWPSPADV